MIDTAKRLFFETGYDQTTLRQISTAAGVSHGSIYHHFADKEGIFLALVTEAFDEIQHLTDREFSDARDPYLRLSLKWAMLIVAASMDRRVAELLDIAYASKKISAEIVASSTLRHRSWLGELLPDWTESDFYAATLVLKGAMAAVVEDKLSRDRLSVEERIRSVLRAALFGFGADANRIVGIVDNVLDSMKRIDPFELYKIQ
ncbi:TetR/AcrR family transcriptional regulator [Burkholderia pyrrocinia]|uniref:TetR/AcrR family transcriptional regulator n=1 Tax=Burkholderia pyrrocinia TaxID=60550 RepID=UPI001BCC2605|nr:TetR/AcrR family transcriptional regulator [Burkholderia pyrrocinia]QVN19377.1 TetR/AcrR family transcriptional regulator [Burkholderia pyrrocinia]